MSTESLNMAALLGAGGSTEWEVAPPGTVIGHLHLRVGDIERASKFHHDALGFDNSVELSGCALPRRWRLPPPRRNQRMEPRRTAVGAQ